MWHFPTAHHLPLHFHKHHWNSELIEFYIFQVLYGVAMGLSSLFLPLYLYVDLGYPLWGVALFFVILQVWCVISAPFGSTMASVIGIKRMMALSIPFMAFFLYSLRFLSGYIFEDLWIIILILGLRSVPRMGYFFALDFFLLHQMKGKTIGRTMAWFKIFTVLASLLTPLVGGTVSYLFGFEALWNVGILIMFISILPLFLTHDKHFPYHKHTTSLFDFIKVHIPKKFIVAETGRVLCDAILWIVWPLYLYFVLKNTAEMGLILSLSGIIAMIISYYVGKRADNDQFRGIFNKGVWGCSLLIFLRALFLTPVAIGLSDAFFKIIEPFFSIPYDKTVFSFVKRSKPTWEIINSRRFISESGYLLATLVICLFFWLIPDPSILLFIICFLFASLSMLLMRSILSLSPISEISSKNDK